MRAISAVVTKRHGSVVARRLPDLVQRCVWKADGIVLSGENAQTNVAVAATGRRRWIATGAVERNSRPGDPGSGSTIIAAEKAGRRCVAMEIEPRYYDVIVKRWQNFTGKQAVLEDDGRTFEAIAGDRLLKSDLCTLASC